MILIMKKKKRKVVRISVEINKFHTAFEFIYVLQIL